MMLTSTGINKFCEEHNIKPIALRFLNNFKWEIFQGGKPPRKRIVEYDIRQKLLKDEHLVYSSLNLGYTLVKTDYHVEVLRYIE